MQGLYRRGKFNRTTEGKFKGCHSVSVGGKRDSVRLEQLPERTRRNDNILWINGERVTTKQALIRAAANRYPVLCQFNETGQPHQLSNAFRHWKRRFEDQHALKLALGYIEGPFVAVVRPV